MRDLRQMERRVRRRMQRDAVLIALCVTASAILLSLGGVFR